MGGSPRGIATLTVVMVLFFILAMVAAYTNRNLIFEQRTSVNSYRATQALVAAEAGLDWAIAQMNGGTIDTSCVASDAATDEFRWRYLTLDFDGTLNKVNEWPLTGDVGAPMPACVMTPGGPQCSCPSGPQSSLQMVDSEAPLVFAVMLQSSLDEGGSVTRPGAIRVLAKGCTSAHTGVTSANINSSKESCHLTTNKPVVDGSLTVETTLGLVSALPVPPIAAITTGGSITQTAGTLRAVNEDTSTGVALYSGLAIAGTTDLRGPAGSSSNLKLENDAGMQGLTVTAGDFFRAMFGMPKGTFSQQPAALRIDCSGGCTWSGVAGKFAANPSRVIYLDGNLSLDEATEIGSQTLPAMLVVTGDVSINAPLTLHGVIYSDGNITWQAAAAAGLVRGALVAAGNFSGLGDAAVAFDAEAVRRVNQAYGSYLRVPGSWRIVR